MFYLDGISLLEASILYSVLFIPLLSILLLLLWTSAGMKNAAKAQLFGIVILIALGFLSINSPIILVIETIAIILLVVWIFVYKDFFLKGQLLVISIILLLQIIYYILFYLFLGTEFTVAIALLFLIPLISMILLFPWAFGNKKSNGRVLIIITYIIQIIFIILMIVLSLTLKSNL